MGDAGFSVTGAAFTLVTVSSGTTSFTAIEASVTTAALIGVSGVDIEVTGSVKLNSTSAANGERIDWTVATLLANDADDLIPVLTLTSAQELQATGGRFFGYWIGQRGGGGDERNFGHRNDARLDRRRQDARGDGDSIGARVRARDRRLLPGHADEAPADPAVANQPRRDEPHGVAGDREADPCAAAIIAVLIPMTSPLVVTSGPPELPGLSAASVWMMSSISRPDRARSERPSALTTPEVTVWSKP